MRTKPTTPFSHAIKSYMTSMLKNTFEAEGGLGAHIKAKNLEAKRIVFAGVHDNGPTQIEIMNHPEDAGDGNQSPESAPKPEMASPGSLQRFMRPTNSPVRIGRRKFSSFKKRDSSKKDSTVSAFSNLNNQK